MEKLKERLLEKVSYLPQSDIGQIKKALAFAQRAHHNQKRQSGKTFFVHPLGVAIFLASRKLDKTTLVAAILHDVIEDTKFSYENIKKEFGKEVGALVDGVTKLSEIEKRISWLPLPKKKKIRLSQKESQAESLRKMLVAMSKDIRVVLIKLADRLNNMKTLASLNDKDREKAIASETLEIYAPLAYRLGMGELKGTLEDLAFPYVYPKEYQELQSFAVPAIKKREKYLHQVEKVLRKKLKKEGIKAEINTRAKHWYSLLKKLEKYDHDLERIYDLVALRIIVPDTETCYRVLGLIHHFWRPLVGRIKDYIAVPKPNGYQSIHTTVFALKGEIVEIQVRTPQMHEKAENGIAAHWHYAENKKSVKLPKEQLAWIKEIGEINKQIRNPREFREDLKTEFFKDRIFTFTPKGDIKEFPLGATPLDFAYAIHSEIGDHCQGVKLNGKLVAFSRELQNGDVVEIIISKKTTPKLEWLDLVKTRNAREKIRHFLNKHRMI